MNELELEHNELEAAELSAYDTMNFEPIELECE